MRTLFTFLFFVFGVHALAQESIVTKTEFTKKTPLEFTDEWQFLTTDIYLFNQESFNTLINNLGKEPKTNLWGKLKSEKIEFLTLTATVKKMGYFNNLDMTYPLFNFKVGYDKSTKYKTQEFEDNEVIRIINNLPLGMSKEFIDALFQGEAITDSQGNKILGTISNQLSNISKLSNPTTAVLTIVGELGSFLDASSAKKQYKFKSTIRLYDDSKFKKKLHSINIYSLKPSSKLKLGDFTTTKVDAFVNSVKFEDEIELSRTKLEELLDYKTYPFLVVVNYKSKYTPPTFSEDDIDQDYIRRYQQRIADDCKNGLNTEVICNQEKELIKYFELYATFKQHKQLYDLNSRNGITVELDKSIFLIMQDYRNLILTKENRDTEFKTTPSYVNDFSPRYIKIISMADRYLSESNKLNDTKLVVKDVIELKKTGINTLNDAKIEQYLGDLYAFALPESQKESDESKEIIKIRGSLEKNIFERTYKRKVDTLTNALPDKAGLTYSKRIKQIINNTKCELCRTEINNSLTEFQKKYDKKLRDDELESVIKLQSSAKDNLTTLLTKKQCIELSLSSIEKSGSASDAQKFNIDEIRKTLSAIEKLKELVGANPNTFSKDELSSYKNNLTTLMGSTTENLNANCNRASELCGTCIK